MKHTGYTPGPWRNETGGISRNSNEDTLTTDLSLLIREIGSLQTAIRYCERIEAVNGPLASVYADYAERLRAVRDGAK